MHDKRRALKKGDTLHFPGMDCEIIELIGKGSNGLVYRGAYADRTTKEMQHDVLIKELFPFDPEGGIARDDAGYITIADESREIWEVHRASFLRGNRFHLELLRKHPEQTGANLNTFELNGTLYTLLGFSGGISLDLYPAPKEGLRGIAERMVGVLDALEVFHASGYLHMDISPDNILIVRGVQHDQVLLIDYNSVLSVRELQEGQNGPLSMKEGYTAPEVMEGMTADIGFSTDLYAVTAVFFTFLMGEPPSLWDQILFDTPDVTSSLLLTEQPETVTFLVNEIIGRGLAAVPEMRYTSVEEMRSAFLELIDRIDRVGITHWALWEKEKQHLDRLIRENPAMTYLTAEDDLYPIRIVSGEASLTLDDFLQKLCRQAGGITLLQASGGMGKTTTLLSATIRQNHLYAPNRPVAVYLSAYDYRAGEAWFIHDRLLETLRFSKDSKTYENARHELELLISEPMMQDGTACPKVILMLDGLNEISGDASLLQKELADMAALRGLSILIASRNTCDWTKAETATLAALSCDEITSILASRNMLLPESTAMQQLLSVPLLLSMYLQAFGISGKKAECAEDLMGSLLRREVENWPEDDDLHWQVDAALHYVLPAVADAQLKQHRALSAQEMLRVVSKCWRVMHSGYLLHAFPEWTGRRKAILGGCSRSDEWYGLIVQEILWQRTGFLVRDEHGCYRVLHQQIGEWLAEAYTVPQAKIRQRTWLAGLCAALTAAVLGVGLWQGVWIPVVQPILSTAQIVTYDEELAEEVVHTGLEAYSFSVRETNAVLELLKAVQASSTIEEARTAMNGRLAACQNVLQAASSSIAPVRGSLLAGSMLESAPSQAVMPWSAASFQKEVYEKLLGFAGDGAQRYLHYLQIVDRMLDEPAYYERFGKEFVNQLIEAVEADEKVACQYFSDFLAPELEGLKKKNVRKYAALQEEMLVLYAVWDVSSETDCEALQREAWNHCAAAGPATRYEGE